MTPNEQIRHFLREMVEAVSEGAFLARDDRERNTLAAIVNDLRVLEDLLQSWAPLTPRVVEAGVGIRSSLPPATPGTD